MDQLVRTLKAAADPTRLRILRMLAVKPLCVCEVMSVLGMAQSTASKHLRILADAGLARAAPGGTWTIYELAHPQAGSPESRLLELVREAETTELSRKDAEKARKADRVRICRQQAEKSFKRQQRG